MKRIIFSFGLLITLTMFLWSCKKYENNKVPVANAGEAQVVQLPIDTILLQGSGSDKDGSVIGYLWSEVSGPNSAAIVTDGSANTAVKNLLAGIYVFQLMVVDNDGATGIDTVSVNVQPAVIKTITLQSNDQNYNELFLAGNDNADYTDPTSSELCALYWTKQGLPDYSRSLFKFNLEQLPSNATILSAKLSLYSKPTPMNGNLKDANYGSDNAMFIQRVVNSWSPATTWQAQPATVATAQVDVPQTNSSMLDLTDIDVTQMVSAMMQQGNYGFMMRLQNEVIYNSRIFCSGKYSDASKHPTLVVTYQ